MSANIPSSNGFHTVLNQAAVWQQLENKTKLGTTGRLGHAEDVASLVQSIQAIRDFIHLHASPGVQKTQALRQVQEFASTQASCKPALQGQSMVNENTRNLHLIASQLNNPAIALPLKVGAALALAEGLEVCTEGVALNILNCACELVNQQHGLVGLVIQTKNTMIDQQLHQLVKNQDSRHLSAFHAENLEIHHVQALKNHVASQWGLAVTVDRYATQAYQTQAGPMAQALLEKTITPATLADVVADQLAEKLIEFTSKNLKTGLPSEQLKTEPLRRLLQAEFGACIELEHCLQFNEDYSEVKLQPREALAIHVVQAFQKIGLVDAKADVQFVHSQPRISTQKALEQTNHLQGVLAFQQYEPLNTARHAEKIKLHSALLSHFWFGHCKAESSDNRSDDERKKSK